MCRGEDREIPIAEAGLEIGAPGVQSFAVADVELDPGDAFDAAGVVVRVVVQAGLLPSGDHVLLDGVAGVVDAHVHGSVGAAGFRDVAVIVFDGLEHGQHFVPGPAGAAGFDPLLVVPGIAADPDPALRAFEPPRTLPRGRWILRFIAAGCGVV